MEKDIVEESLLPIHKEEAGLCGTLSGLTLPQEEDARQKFLEELPFAIVALDHEGRIAIVNKQTELIFGYSRHDMLGKPVEMLIPTALRISHVGFREGFVEDPKTRQMGVSGPLSGLHRNGNEISLAIHLAPITVQGIGVLPIAVIQKIAKRTTPK